MRYPGMATTKQKTAARRNIKKASTSAKRKRTISKLPKSTPGTTATTSVWFPPGSDWTDYFTGKTYAGGTTQDVTTGLDSMPVFIRSGGILTTRTDDVTNDVQNPLDKVTVTVAGGQSGSSALYEDNGSTTDAAQSATTPIQYTDTRTEHLVHIAPVSGSSRGSP